ncbi:MAG: exodeoxyribonuclease III [Gammaproteobacteria bacterium]|nr:MAG: exodeoxyribonuclease III [Gammaproteobacteria bacterium]
MLRVISFNANGIRAAARKGFFDWLPDQNADFVCIQETKAQVHQLEDPVFWPEGYHCFYNDAEKKGYAGTALYCRKEPDEISSHMGCDEFDREGRWLEARYPGLSVASLYVPSGSAGPERQASKDRFLECFMPILKGFRRKRREYIICGDWNIAHKEIDLKNWKQNQKNSGFLPHERAWMDELFGPAGFVDAFRVINQEPDQYTWWSNRGRAWEKNVGWRIDYQVITPRLRDKVLAVSIYKEQRFSDHAPLIIDYDIDL